MKISQTLKAGLYSGIIAAVINNLYGIIYKNVTGIKADIINPVSISLSSILPLVIAGLVFYLLASKLKNGSFIFSVTSIVLGLLSLYSSFQPVLPDGTAVPQGFALLSAPMHIVAAICAAVGIPKFSQ
jgi:hypothetical protein